MSLLQFKKLPQDVQCRITWNAGVLIAYRTGCNTFMCLYRLDNFFVEMEYSSCCDGVACIHVFEDEDALPAYLDDIDLSEIFALC